MGVLTNYLHTRCVGYTRCISSQKQATPPLAILMPTMWHRPCICTQHANYYIPTGIYPARMQDSCHVLFQLAYYTKASLKFHLRECRYSLRNGEIYSFWNSVAYELNIHLINTLKKSLVIVHLNLHLSPLGWHVTCMQPRYNELLNS